MQDLIFTLGQIATILQRKDVECMICDDGSNDGTTSYLKGKHPNINLIRNEKSKGLIYSRNKLMELVKSDFAISIDDDLHFITENPTELIEDYFNHHPKCALIGFRIFWGKKAPERIATNEKPHRMKSFAGGAHAWRMDSWRKIPDYPSWFIFHGEEDFAAYEMFKKNLEIHYLPSVLVHHRVDIAARKKDADYTIRLRRSLRSGWFLYFLFFPLKKIPRLMAYSLWIQLKTKVFRGDFRAMKAMCQALIDLIVSSPKIAKNRNRLSLNEYNEFQKLEGLKLYWKPEI